MPNIGIPASGIQIQHKHADSKPSPQIIRLNLTAADADNLIRCVRNGETARLKTGKTPQVVFGTKHVSVRHAQDKFPQEIFAGSFDDGQPAFFSGKLSHTLEVQQAKEATAGVDEALEKLKNNLRQSQDERNSTDSGSVSNKLLKPQHRPSPLGSGLLGSRPSSPFLSAGFSPRSGPTSAPLLPGQSKEEKLKLAAIKIPVIHLLAVEAQDPKKLAETVRVKKSDLDQVLMKVAQDGQGGKKKLKDRAYRDLDVWNFPYQSQNDRQSAIDHAVSAYDRQRIDKSDNLWQMLLAKQDRNKGINLSRLNFDKPLATGNLTPKVPEKSTDGGSTEGKSMKSTSSDQAVQKGKVPVSKLTDTHPKTKPNAERLPKSVKDLGKSSSTSKITNKPKDTKTDAKFKSSERIEHSDEEANAGPSVPATTVKRSDHRQSKQPRSDKSSTTTVKPPLHKPQLSGSSGTSSDPDRGRLTPSSTMVKTRGGADSASTANNPKSTKHLDRNSPRPRNGSSPIKPSPLGSSPPTKVRDIDSTSNSSKSTALSSAPSSPPSTSDSSQPLNRRSAVTANSKPEKLANGVKRKAEMNQDAPPAKREHLTNGKNDPNRFSSLPKPLADELQRQPRAKRDSPDSDTSSSTDRPINKEQLIEEARKFHKYYAKYKDLHDKLNRTASNDRDDSDLDQVWKQHMRLKEMKEQIWKDWDKLERLGKT